MTQPFATWLLTQTDRDDPVGDLARDYSTGAALGEHDTDHRTPADVRRDVLTPAGASPGAHEALDRAAGQWWHERTWREVSAMFANDPELAELAQASAHRAAARRRRDRYRIADASTQTARDALRRAAR